MFGCRFQFTAFCKNIRLATLILESFLVNSSHLQSIPPTEPHQKIPSKQSTSKPHCQNEQITTHTQTWNNKQISGFFSKEARRPKVISANINHHQDSRQQSRPHPVSVWSSRCCSNFHAPPRIFFSHISTNPWNGNSKLLQDCVRSTFPVYEQTSMENSQITAINKINSLTFSSKQRTTFWRQKTRSSQNPSQLF